MAVRERVLRLIRKLFGTQMIVDILREQRRADDWAPHITSSVLVEELHRRLEKRIDGVQILDNGVRDYLLTGMGSDALKSALQRVGSFDGLASELSSHAMITEFARRLQTDDAVESALLEGSLGNQLLASMSASSLKDALRRIATVDDWASELSGADILAEFHRRLASRAGDGSSALDVELRGHLLSIIGARLGASATHDVHVAAKQAFDTLIAGLHPDALAVAEVVALDFREALRDPDLPLAVACRYYDILYGLYWCGAQRFTDMARFDTKAVIPFAEWLRRHYRPEPESRPLPQPGQPLRVGYLCTYAHLQRGNAIAPLVRSIVLEHARHPGRDVFMYCVQWSSPDFVAGFDGTGVTVRDLPQGHTYHGLDGIVNAIRADQIDVLITDTGTAVPTYVFSRRAAPVQMWIDMGYPFWSIGELDWVMLPHKGRQPYFGIPVDRWSPVRFRQHAETMVRPVTEAQVAEARAVVPAGGFVMACFTRLIKVTPEYAKMALRLLREVPGSRLLLIGGGASREAEQLASDPGVGGRVTLVRGLVDLNVYARVVDVFLDTYPFIGGLAAREMAACGVPVVSMLTGEWDLADERDDGLCARTDDEYCALVGRLARDTEFREACRERSRALVGRYVDVDDMMGMIEDGIGKVIDYVNRKEARMLGGS